MQRGDVEAVVDHTTGVVARWYEVRLCDGRRMILEQFVTDRHAVAKYQTDSQVCSIWGRTQRGMSYGLFHVWTRAAGEI